MIEFLSSLKFKRNSHSPFNEDAKSIFFRQALFLGGGATVKFWENGQ